MADGPRLNNYRGQQPFTVVGVRGVGGGGWGPTGGGGLWSVGWRLEMGSNYDPHPSVHPSLPRLLLFRLHPSPTVEVPRTSSRSGPDPGGRSTPDLRTQTPPVTSSLPGPEPPGESVRPKVRGPFCLRRHTRSRLE